MSTGRRSSQSMRCKSSRGGIAAQAAVENRVTIPGKLDFFLDQRGISLRRRIVETVSGREAVAEKQNRARRVPGTRRRGERYQQKRENRAEKHARNYPPTRSVGKRWPGCARRRMRHIRGARLSRPWKIRRSSKSANSTKTYRSGERGIDGAQGGQLLSGSRRDVRHRRAVGQRQDDAARPLRRARPGDERLGRAGRRGAGRSRRGCPAHRGSQRAHRVRVPEFSSSCRRSPTLENVMVPAELRPGKRPAHGVLADAATDLLRQSRPRRPPGSLSRATLPASSSSAWRWPARSSTAHASCSPTSPPATSTPRRAPASSICSSTQLAGRDSVGARKRTTRTCRFDRPARSACETGRRLIERCPVARPFAIVRADC